MDQEFASGDLVLVASTISPSALTTQVYLVVREATDAEAAANSVTQPALWLAELSGSGFQVSGPGGASCVSAASIVAHYQGVSSQGSVIAAAWPIQN